MDDSMVVKGTPVVSASAVPSPPPGMLAKTTTTKYPDGREVTSTEFVPAESVTASATSAAAAPQTVRAPPVGIRRDLGYDPVSITCQYCNQPTPTRTVKDIGACTWISCIILFFFFLPLFWLPFVCSDVSEFAKKLHTTARSVEAKLADRVPNVAIRGRLIDS
eukprot:CCRYP_006387-RA/>CCRYP_006387-RA protein AED:0.30 eAED:0.33 QI:0/0/0/1/0/0.5/2/1274/162